MVKTAYSKINLTLEILGTKRGDGFHDLKSVMHKIPLGDVISVDLKKGTGNVFLNCSENVCDNENNLAYMSAKAYLSEYQKENKVDFDVYINLVKITPTGAGLGGGSADAACVLDIMSDLLCGVSEDKKELIAATLGSDVVFCLDKYKSAYCSGRGEICKSIDTLPKNTCILIAKPNQSLNTKGIYKSYDERYGDDYSKSSTDKMVQALALGDVTKIAHSFVNDFEGLCIDRLGEIGKIKREISRLGAYVSGMSGSGSAVFGLFDSSRDCFEGKKILLESGLEQVFAFSESDFEKMYKGE